MASRTCPQCGAPLPENAAECKYCGEAFPQAEQKTAQNNYYYQAQYQQPQPVVSTDPGINPAWPIKSKVTAGVLAILVGGLGIHKFYLGKSGLLYLIFSWTGIPSFIGFIEGIIYLCSNDHNFQVKNQVRLQ
ncbi:MAG: NINE protein [Clostridia bacterium]